jgi:hypothetical protein
MLVLRAEATFMLEARVASLLHSRLGYDRLLNGEAPEVVYLDEDGRLFSAPVSDSAASVLRFKLVKSDIQGATYSLLLHHQDFQFTASHGEGAIALSEYDEFSPDDTALLEKLLRHLETASKRTLVRRPRSNKPLWQRLFAWERLAKTAP